MFKVTRVDHIGIAVKDLEQIARKTKLKDNGTPLWAQDENTYSNFSGHVLNI